MSKRPRKISERLTPPEWIKWASGVLLSTLGAGTGVAVFAYQNFETVVAAERREVHSKEIREIDSARLERIEEKLDVLLTKQDKSN